jgi:hypothetical protein
MCEALGSISTAKKIIKKVGASAHPLNPAVQEAEIRRIEV